MHKFIAALLAIALAGCAGSPADAPEAPDGGDGTGDGPGAPAEGNDTADEPSEPSPEEDVIPWEPSLLVDVANGTAPLNVTFTIDAVGAPNATWELSLGDGNTTAGDALPATVAHTYGPGNHTAVLTVSVGDVSKEVSVAVAAVAVPPIVLPYTAEVLIGLPWLLFDPTGEADPLEMSSVAWESYGLETPNAHGFAFTVPAGATMLEIVSQRLPATGGAEHPEALLCEKGDPVAPDTDMFLFAADGTFIADSGSCGTGEAISLEAPAAGDYVVVQLGFLGADMEIPTTVTIHR